MSHWRIIQIIHFKRVGYFDAEISKLIICGANSSQDGDAKIAFKNLMKHSDAILGSKCIRVYNKSTHKVNEFGIVRDYKNLIQL